MFQGFYNLTSGMLTQTRNLNVISNNMSNISTPGYKNEMSVSKTFEEEMIYRSGYKDKSNPVQVGALNRIVTNDRIYTDFSAGAYAQTGRNLDFALDSDGFFSIQGAEGTVYTRAGSFSLDNEGYLTLQGVGRVLGTNGSIHLGTDKVTTDSAGNIYAENNGRFLGRLSIVDFQDKDAQLQKGTGNTFTANGPGIPVNAVVINGALENSNVSPVQEMAAMMSSQRSLQSSAQVMKMYDQLTGKIISQLGPA